MYHINKCTTSKGGGLTFNNVHLYTTNELMHRRHKLKQVLRIHRKHINPTDVVAFEYPIHVAGLTLRYRAAQSDMSAKLATFMFGGAA